MAKKKDVPNFGPLSGVKVVHSSMSIAGPFAAQFMAEFGADVIWIESPLSVDIARAPTGMQTEQDRRNQRSIALNIPSPEGKETFLQLIADADIFIEASKGGQFSKWGLTDEVLWEHNPALVIAHISGYGQDGIEEYVHRPSYDGTAQAYSCFMQLNGFPDRQPIPAFPFVGDFLTGLLTLSSVLAALHKAKETGQGESIDMAQFEAIMRCQLNYPMDDINLGKKPVREGTHSSFRAGVGVYKCKDGKDVYIFFVGAGVLLRGLSFLGLEYGSREFPEDIPVVLPNTPGGDLLEEKLVTYCASKSALEVDDELNKAGIPCSVIMDYQMALKDPHYQARKVFMDWNTIDGRTIKGVNVIPKLKNNPGRVWRGAPTIGMDNDDILSDIGYTKEKINELYVKKVIIKKELERTW